MMIFSFLRKKIIKNQTQICFVVIVLFPLFKQFGLAIEHNKSEVFHFSRAMKNFDPPLLDLGPLEGPLLQPKDKWTMITYLLNPLIPKVAHGSNLLDISTHYA